MGGAGGRERAARGEVEAEGDVVPDPGHQLQGRRERGPRHQGHLHVPDVQDRGPRADVCVRRAAQDEGEGRSVGPRGRGDDHGHCGVTMMTTTTTTVCVVCVRARACVCVVATTYDRSYDSYELVQGLYVRTSTSSYKLVQACTASYKKLVRARPYRR